MSTQIPRREFLKSASVAAGALRLAARDQSPARTDPASVRIGVAKYTPVADYPIQPVRYSDVRLTDTFWKPKVGLNASVTIPFEVDKAGEGARGLRAGVLEAAILSLATHPNPALQRQVDDRVRAIAQAQSSGNGGFEIAATYFNTTGRRDLLDPALKAADALYENFRTTNPPFSGGERDAMNCVQLYRVTHDRKHLDLAKHYLDIRGLENSVNRSRHNQSYKPVLEQREAVGHAVNCVTLMVSLADVGVLTGLRDYFVAAQRMWTDVVDRKMYVTGGVGTTGNEGFGEPYSLPNISAYSETCAVLMFITLNHRLFMATGDAKYIDVMERGMYNNAIDGVSASGNRFFYVNRLASAGDGRDLRWERASLECCPPNLVRFLASMPGLIYAHDAKDNIYVNLYVSSETTFKAGARNLALSMASEMPWGGKSKLTITDAGDVPATIKLRMPGWARNQALPSPLYQHWEPVSTPVTIALNGQRVVARPDRLGYVSIQRTWKSGDVIDIDLPMPPQIVVPDTRVRDDVGRIAFERGPIVYCAEWPDVEGGKTSDLLVGTKRSLAAVPGQGALAGMTVLETDAGSVTNPAAPAKAVTLIPYHFWANRGAGEMNVWLRIMDYMPGEFGPAGGYIFYVNPNYARDGWRYLEAAPFDQSAGAPWGCFRQLIAGARGTAVGTGKQNTADMLAACSDATSAAALCANLKVNGVGGWFLPSRDELALMYRNLQAPGGVRFHEIGTPDNFTYWASSQQTADMAAHIDFADLGRQHGDDKDFPRRVRAIRAF